MVASQEYIVMIEGFQNANGSYILQVTSNNVCSDLPDYNYYYDSSARAVTSSNKQSPGVFLKQLMQEEKASSSSDRRKSSKIVNGVEAVPQSTPWMVSLQFGSSFSYHACGGSLISPTEVLTAAHCVQDPADLPNHVIIGAHDNSADDHPDTERIAVSEVFYSADYDDSSTTSDVAIIVLAEPSTHDPVPVYGMAGYTESDYPALADEHATLK